MRRLFAAPHHVLAATALLTLAARGGAQAAPSASGLAGAPAPSEQAVRAATRAVFTDDAYDRSLRRTLLDRFIRWIGDLFERLGDAAGNGPGWRWIATAVLVVIGLALLARIVVLLRSTDAAATRGSRARGGRGADDPWAAAQRLAESGDHTGAAHALYQALVEAIARRARIRTHPSKTVGDYGRDLRARGSALAAPYREFARVYEVVVYGEGYCDRDRWERLLALAIPMLRDASAVTTASGGRASTRGAAA